jgi:hypothetical protein
MAHHLKGRTPMPRVHQIKARFEYQTTYNLRKYFSWTLSLQNDHLQPEDAQMLSTHKLNMEWFWQILHTC